MQVQVLSLNDESYRLGSSAVMLVHQFAEMKVKVTSQIPTNSCLILKEKKSTGCPKNVHCLNKYNSTLRPGKLVNYTLFNRLDVNLELEIMLIRIG